MDTQKELTLSESQQRAVSSLDTSLCVSAGAGSGKTTVLVNRFLHIATARKVSPERIVAITYTEKAANRMKEKLVEKFTELNRVDERRALENSYISTIHSFGARLLRENPVEAGVDPRFSVLEPVAAALVMDEVLDEVLEQCSGEEKIFHLLSRYGTVTVCEALKNIYEKVRARGATLESLQAAAAAPDGARVWKELEGELQAYIRERRGARNSATGERNLSAAADLLKIMPAGAAVLEAREFALLCGAKFDKRADKKIVEKICGLRDTALLLEAEKWARPYKEAFMHLYGIFTARFQSRKDEGAFLDFDDLLLRACELFSGEDEIRAAIRRRYQEKFEFILVDEYQDTSRVQAEWIGRLARKNNLFIVGDEKQSIYRFRNAEVEVFRERRQELPAVELNDNYRSRPEILNFVNGLFGRIWAEDGFAFSPLEARREFPAKTMPSIEWLPAEQNLVEDGKTEEQLMNQARVREARALARRIRQLIEGRQLRVTGRDGVEREARYRDVTILFRAMTSSGLYEQELRQAGIPYFVVRGRGFYEKQEIADLVNFLVVIDKPENDIPLASVLRSPLAGLSEDGLYWLSQVKEGDVQGKTPLSHGLRDPRCVAKLSADDRRKLEDFLRRFEFFRERKDKLKISEMLAELIHQTHYDIVLLGKPDGKRKHANVRKLMDFARGFETKEAFGLRDFIRYMEKLLVAEAQESEAQVELEEADTVKLMSVHKAKGLEFPVVALADLGYEPRNWEGGRLNFSGSQGLGLKVKNETTHEWHETWSYAENKSQEQRKNRDEHKRLFYVALTRAEEHLLLSGVARPVKEGALEEAAYRDLSSWMDWLRKAFSGSETDVNGRLLFEGLPVHVPAQEAETSPHRRLPLLAETSPFKEALTELRPLDERALKKLEERLFPGITEDALTRAALPAAKETPYYETLDLPVSALLKFEECPGCYYDLYEMREPDKMRDEPVDESEEPEEEEETPLARREFGNLFHRIMQHFDFEAPVDAELARRLEEVRPFVNEAELHELEQSVRNFLGGEWGAVFKRSELYRELPFIYKLTRGELRGQIDVAAKTPEGEWIVLDYKTGRATAEESGERAREYELQILIYSLALRDTGGYVPKRGILYFTSPDRSHFIDLSPESLDRTREKINKLLEDMVLQQRPFKHQAPKCRKQ